MLAHRATISKDIGETFFWYTAIPPKEAKAPTVATGLGFLRIGGGKMHIFHGGHAANSVRTQSEKQHGGRRDLSTAALPTHILPYHANYCALFHFIGRIWTCSRESVASSGLDPGSITTRSNPMTVKYPPYIAQNRKSPTPYAEIGDLMIRPASFQASILSNIRRCSSRRRWARSRRDR